MSEKKEKNYIASSTKEIITAYGSMFVQNFKLEDLVAIGKNGWVSIVTAKRKEASEKGATHYSYENTYEPQGKKEYKKPEAKKSYTEDNDDLPF